MAEMNNVSVSEDPTASGSGNAATAAFQNQIYKSDTSPERALSLIHI